MIRDTLLLDLALGTGMRKGELADSEPKDIHTDFLIAHGKGGKERGYADLVAMALSEGMLEEARKKNVHRELHQQVKVDPASLAILHILVVILTLRRCAHV